MKKIFILFVVLLISFIGVKSVFAEESNIVREDQDPEGPRSAYHLLHFVDGNVVVSGHSNFSYNDGGDIFRSTDGGVTFEIVEDYVAPLRGSFAFKDDKVGYVAGYRSGFGLSMYVGKTTDGGRTWECLRENMDTVRPGGPDNPRTMEVANVITPGGNSVFVSGLHTVYGSPTAGSMNSWQKVAGAKDTSGDRQLYTWSLDHIDGLAYIAAYDGFEYKDVTQGAKGVWSRYDGVPWDHEGGQELNSITFMTKSSGVALVEDTNDPNNTMTLYRTDDGGMSWQPLASSSNDDRETVFPRSGNLIFHDGKIFGTGRISVEDQNYSTRYGAEGNYEYPVYSEDGGTNWIRDGWFDEDTSSLRYVKAGEELRIYRYSSGHRLSHYGRYAPHEAGPVAIEPEPEPEPEPVTPSPSTSELHRENIPIFIDGNRLSLDEENLPVIQEGRTLVPMRAFFEALGADVDWDPNERAAVGIRDGIEVRIPIDSTTPTVQGQVVSIDASARIFDGRTFIPLRFVGQALGDDVNWDGETRTISIAKINEQDMEPEPITTDEQDGDTLESSFNWDGGTYSGEAVNGVPNGHGTWHSDEGHVYEGEWKDGAMDGHGTFIHSDGFKYVGDWRKNEMHGHSTWTSPEGEKYVGEYKYGQRSGEGTYTWPNGDRYEGEWKDGQMHGFGTLHEGDFIYEGGWQNDTMHGEGTVTGPDGSKISGSWEYGEPVIIPLDEGSAPDVGSPAFGEISSENLTLRYGFNGAAVFDHLKGEWHFHEMTTITRSAVNGYVNQVNERFALAVGLNEFAVYDLATNSWNVIDNVPADDSTGMLSTNMILTTELARVKVLNGPFMEYTSNKGWHEGDGGWSEVEETDQEGDLFPTEPTEPVEEDEPDMTEPTDEEDLPPCVIEYFETGSFPSPLPIGCIEWRARYEEIN